MKYNPEKEMQKTFNIYCDESTHLENDGMPYMVMGYISCPYHLLKVYKNTIKELKAKHKFKGEIKWNKVSSRMEDFYLELIEFFFSSQMTSRAVIIEKEDIVLDKLVDTFDKYYFKMYYKLLYDRMNDKDTYNVYLDIKDTCSYIKLRKLEQILEFNNNTTIRNFQFMRSHESSFIQLTDFLIGAINYKLRKQDSVSTKNKLTQRIEQLCGYRIETAIADNKDNDHLFYVELK